MRHPFAGILTADAGGENETHDADAQTRREVLQSAVGLGVGAVALGVAGTALGQITTQAIDEEGAKRPPAVTKAGPGHPEHGGRPRPAVTRAGLAHPEHAGQKVRNAMSELAQAQALLAKGDWAGAAAKLSQVKKLAAPKQDKYGHYKRLQQRRKAMEKPLKKTITKALDQADKQAAADRLVPTLQTYRKADKLDEHYGYKKRAGAALEKFSKRKDYQVALKKVQQLEAKEKKPKATTLAIGEEGGKKPGVSTRARGEEGGRPGITTQAIGEEGGRKPRPRPVTDAIGERG
jgi:hypothetical protein